MTLADKIVVLRDGAIEQVGAPLELYHHPKNLFVAGFIGSPKMNLLTAQVIAVSESGITVRLTGIGELEVPMRPSNLKPDEPVTVGVRSEHLELNQHGQFQGEVLIAERLGSETYLHVQMKGGKVITITTNGDSPARIHDRVTVQVNGNDCHLFNAAGEAV
jgi:multiple sugar transport system ATP-binding protein